MSNTKNDSNYINYNFEGSLPLSKLENINLFDYLSSIIGKVDENNVPIGVTGTITYCSPNNQYYYINFCDGLSGWICSSQLGDEDFLFNVGTKIDVSISRYDSKHKTFNCSRKNRIRAIKIWQKSNLCVGQVIFAKVVYRSKNYYLCDIGGGNIVQLYNNQVSSELPPEKNHNFFKTGQIIKTIYLGINSSSQMMKISYRNIPDIVKIHNTLPVKITAEIINTFNHKKNWECITPDGQEGIIILNDFSKLSVGYWIPATVAGFMKNKILFTTMKQYRTWKPLSPINISTPINKANTNSNISNIIEGEAFYCTEKFLYINFSYNGQPSIGKIPMENADQIALRALVGQKVYFCNPKKDADGFYICDQNSVIEHTRNKLFSEKDLLIGSEISGPIIGFLKKRCFIDINNGVCGILKANSYNLHYGDNITCYITDITGDNPKDMKIYLQEK